MERVRTVPKQAEHVTCTNLEGELVLYDPRAEHVHILNSTAALIWQLCDGIRDKSAIAGEVAEGFGASRRDVTRDVVSAIRQLYDAGLVEYLSEPIETSEAAGI
ncbi:MAG: PqqD family protein [Chloroflexi bacterium]|nr:PqqD family protein [Chloroflexota bacterium]